MTSRQIYRLALSLLQKRNTRRIHVSHMLYAAYSIYLEKLHNYGRMTQLLLHKLIV